MLRTSLPHRNPGGLTAEELAERTGSDAFYVGVWCRSAFGAGLCTRAAGRYALAPHMDTLLLDTGSPAYVGRGVPGLRAT